MDDAYRKEIIAALNILIEKATTAQLRVLLAAAVGYIHG